MGAIVTVCKRAEGGGGFLEDLNKWDVKGTASAQICFQHVLFSFFFNFWSC